jgi:hypothetical protein
MFRSAAVLRSAASAAARRSIVATTTSRSFSAISRPTLVSSPKVASVVPVSRVAGWTAVRCYAAGSGLSKQDVEGRITSLLAGFDKVRLILRGRLYLDVSRRVNSSCCGCALSCLSVVFAADWSLGERRELATYSSLDNGQDYVEIFEI